MSTIDFDEAFAPLEPKNTAKKTLLGVRVNSDKDVVLIGQHAGQGNGRHQSLMLKLSEKHAAELRAGDPIGRRAIVNAILAQALSKTVLTGWENVCSKDGKPAPFTAEACEAFLVALQRRRPEIAGDNGTIEMFFLNADNFCDGYKIGDVSALGEG